MGIKLSDLLVGEKPLELDFGDGHVLHVTYRPEWATPARAREDARLRAEGDNITANLRQFLHAFSKWDLLDDAGKPVPLTEAALADIPGAFITQIWEKMAEQINLGKPNATA